MTQMQSQNNMGQQMPPGNVGYSPINQEPRSFYPGGDMGYGAQGMNPLFGMTPRNLGNLSALQNSFQPIPQMWGGGAQSLVQE